jgi:hypothetical protein
MRSTQFDDYSPFEEKPEEHRQPTKQTDTRCETLKRLRYTRNNQVTLYGEVFDLLSDPIRVGEDFVFVNALERKSGHVRRVSIPRTIVQMTKKD